MDTPGIHKAAEGEKVRVRNMPGKFVFKKYGHDGGGDFAVVVGGISGHRKEHCVTVDRIQPQKGQRRQITTISTDLGIQSDRTDGTEDDGEES